MKLEMWLFGDFGYEPLLQRYEQLNPGVTVDLRAADYSTAYHRGLPEALDAGSGPDIVAIEAAFLDEHRARPDRFHNLLDVGAAELEDMYLDWKWSQGMTTDRSVLIGLGTDTGPMTMAFRRDLLEAAGLPGDRRELAELWRTWSGFADFGRRYTEATGRRFVNDLEMIFKTVASQSHTRYYDADDSPVFESNPRVRQAWDIAAEMAAVGVASDIVGWTPEWSAAVNDGAFAAFLCPAWMRIYLERNAPHTSGRWDMILLPEGGGNWGGSFLALPAASDKQEAAYELISWLLAPAQQLDVFKRIGNFPSTPELYDSEDIQGFTDGFFGDAPVGQLYAMSAMANIEPRKGPADGIISARFHNALQRVASGVQTPDDAWDSACEAIRRGVAGSRGPALASQG